MVESLPERDSLLQQLSAFAKRHALAAVSANRMASPGKDRTLHFANTIVSSKAGKDANDYDLLNSAYKCLYVGSASRDETCQVVKKHQHYIIQLTSSKSWIRAFVELGTLHGVFGGNTKFQCLSWSSLLDGVACDASFPVALVVSYHFLILQTLLQAISSSLLSVAKGSGELGLAMFQRVAETFLAGSNVVKWMELVDSHHMAKYHANCVKMLRGFVKVAKFLQGKDRSLVSQLSTSLNCLSMKLYEYEAKTDLVAASEPDLPDLAESASITLKFARELHLTLSQASKLPRSEFYSRLAAYCKNGDWSMNIEQESSPKFRKLLSSSISDTTIAEIASFIQNSESLLLPIHLQVLNYIHQHIATQTSSQLAPMINLYIHKLQLLARHSGFDCLLHTFIPSLMSMIAELGLLRSLKQLEIMCFNHFKATSLTESLAMTIEILLSQCRIETKPQEISKSLSRVERCLESLSVIGESSKVSELAYSYMTSFPDRTESLSERIMRAIALCFVNTPLVSELWFGSHLEFTDDQKIVLVKALCEGLVGRNVSETSTEWVSALRLSSPSAHVHCLYEVARNFQVDVALPSFQITSSVSYLFCAYVRLQCLFRKNAAYRSVLRELHSDIISWENSDTKVSPEESSIVLDILSQLYYLGYFNLTAELVSRLKTTKKLPHNLDNFQLELITADLHLRLSKLSVVPDILQDAGNILKIVHLEGSLVDCNFLIRWKLIQLEYFVKMQDTTKTHAKFEDIKRLMLKFPEYDLKADSSDIALSRRLECLMYTAQLLILTSESNRVLGSYVLALKNLKLALKVLNSIIRKLGSANMKMLKIHTEILMLSCYSRAFQLCRHLGLLSDAIFYLEELGKLNDNVQNPMFNCLFHFDVSTSYASVGKEKECLDHTNKGKLISTHANIVVLEHLSRCSDTVYQALFTPLLKISKNNLADFQNLSSLPTKGVYDALCEDYLLDVKYEVEVSMCLKLSGLLQSKENSTFEKRSMIIRAMTLVSSNLHEVKSMLLRDWSDEFDKTIKQLPHFATMERRQISDTVQRKLLDCKEILNNCFEEGWPTHLEVRNARQVNSLFNRCIFLLSFVAVLMPESAKDLLNSVHYLLDMPKSLPYVNQQRINESQLMRNESGNELLPIFTDRNAGAFDGIQPDFDENLRTLLPSNWVVVTLDICGVAGDLVLSKFSNADAHPHFYKVPVTKHFSSFQDILMRLKKIIDDSNYSTSFNVTSNVKTKEDRKKWWQLRFNLDLQLENLLADVEKHLVGSLRGIFDRPDRKARGYQDFKSKLNQLWRASRKKDSSLALSDSLVDLYYCARPFDADGVFDSRRLEDLVAITVDELQASNSCTKRELLSSASLYGQLEELYTSADTSSTDCKHLVLVPSSACCSFPWESLSSLRKKSISRVPSIEMLTNLLQKHHTMKVFDEVSKNQIFYLVNPGQDLKRTQQRFEPIFKSIPSAEGLAGQAPDEEYLISRLYASGLYVYLGHGGGEQYMRTSTLFKAHGDNLSKHLPPAILMGCSSGAYQTNGELEPTSNVFNWLVCGAPMVVANLWDITDKDIDNFSDSVFAKWGFLPDQQHQVDICRAVASSRDSCTLKHLNGAAPIVHGLPLNFH